MLLIGNIGLSQLTKSTMPDLVKALEGVGADAVAVHTNPLQEAIQSGGDTDFSGAVARLRNVSGALGYPILLQGGRPRAGRSGGRRAAPGAR